MFFCLKKTCSSVLLSLKKSCSHVLLSLKKTCSSVLMSLKNHVLPSKNNFFQKKVTKTFGSFK